MLLYNIHLSDLIILHIRRIVADRPNGEPRRPNYEHDPASHNISDSTEEKKQAPIGKTALAQLSTYTYSA